MIRLTKNPCKALDLDAVRQSKHIEVWRNFTLRYALTKSTAPAILSVKRFDSAAVLPASGISCKTSRNNSL